MIILGHNLFVAAVIVLSLVSMTSGGRQLFQFHRNFLSSWIVADILSENIEY